MQPDQVPIVVMELQRSIEEEVRHWLLGQALGRIRKFCSQYDTDVDPLVFTREVERDFVKDRDHTFLLLLAVQDMKVVGHLLSEHCFYYGRSFILIQQFEMNHPECRLAFEEERKAFHRVVDWQSERKAVEIRAAVRDPAHMIWFKEFGFTRTYTLMKR